MTETVAFKLNAIRNTKGAAKVEAFMGSIFLATPAFHFFEA